MAKSEMDRREAAGRRLEGRGQSAGGKEGNTDDARRVAVQRAMAKAHEGCAPPFQKRGTRNKRPTRPPCCRQCVYATRVRDGNRVLWVCVNTPKRPGQIVCVKPEGKCPHFCPKRARVVRGTPPEPPDSGSRYIPLTRGRFALVDAADYEWLSRCKWCVTGQDRPYACRHDSGKTIYMHREIMNTPAGLCVDHINGHSLDNRRCNLRNCTHADNMRNRRGNSGRSLYKGVTFQAHCGKYKASIGAKGCPKHIGYYDDPAEAARAYDRKARELFGPFAWLNFPEPGREHKQAPCKRKRKKAAKPPKRRKKG